MSDTVDLTLLSSSAQGVERELRLSRIELDNLVPRVAILEQSLHELVSAVSHGFGQMQQHLARLDKRMETLDTGLTDVRTALDESTERLIKIMKEGSPS
jgi:hypothetical protein